VPEFPPRTDSQPLDTERILRALGDAGVRYVLIGGVASIVHGAEQTTYDADLLPALDSENLGRLLEVLASLRAGVLVDESRLAMEAGELWETAVLRSGPDGLLSAEAWHFSTDAGLVDVVMSAAGVGGFDAHIPNARTLKLFGMTVAVAGIEVLVRSKEFLGRAKDLPVVEQLRRIQEEN